MKNSTLTTQKISRTFAICQRYSGASSERTEYGSFCGFFWIYGNTGFFTGADTGKEEMQDTSGHNVQKTEPEIDGDEIIDLGDETEQVLAEMKKTLESEQETELAFSIADRLSAFRK